MSIVSSVVVLVAGLLMIVIAIGSIRKYDLIKAACGRLCERAGWTDYDPDSRALWYIFVGMLVVGSGWVIAALVNF